MTGPRIDGLWAIGSEVGRANNGPTNTLFFAAGPNDENGGAFGRSSRPTSIVIDRAGRSSPARSSGVRGGSRRHRFRARGR